MLSVYSTVWYIRACYSDMWLGSKPKTYLNYLMCWLFYLLCSTGSIGWNNCLWNVWHTWVGCWNRHLNNQRIFSTWADMSKNCFPICQWNIEWVSLCFMAIKWHSAIQHFLRVLGPWWVVFAGHVKSYNLLSLAMTECYAANFKHNNDVEVWAGTKLTVKDVKRNIISPKRHSWPYIMDSSEMQKKTINTKQ